jgi:hypothetical protein
VNVVGPHLAQENHGGEYFRAPVYHESNRGIDGADVGGNTKNVKARYKEDQVTYQAVPTWRARSVLQKVG